METSALIAILDEEEDAARYAGAISEDDTPLLSAAAMVEAGIVMLRRHGPRGARKVNALIQEAGIQVEGVSRQHAQLALEAYAAYGKRRKKGAGLNCGD